MTANFLSGEIVLAATRYSLAYFSGNPTEESVSDSASAGSGAGRPAKNTLFAPSGVNLKMAPLKFSATKRLPDASNVKLRGDVVTLAKSLLVPAGVNLKIVFSLSPTKTLPPLSIAST